MTRLWKFIPVSPLAAPLAHEAGLTPLQAQLLLNRGISTARRAETFLNPRLAYLADPMGLKDMDRAVDLIRRAVRERTKITIYGDYDADGLTAAALLHNFFTDLGLRPSCYIPDRLNEGYGLNRAAVRKIAADGTRLLITVDCGVSSAGEISLARELGMEVVVTDHHRVPAGTAPSWPLVNPHRPDCNFPFKELSGVGVAFFLAVAVRGALRGDGWFARRPEPDLRRYLDLVALGTVADRVPLVDQNRLLVHSGLAVMPETRWAGIRAMTASAGITGPAISSDDLAFRMAPRLNAAGRVGDAGTGLEILTAPDPSTADDLARRLNQANAERQNLEKAVMDRIAAREATAGGFGDRRTFVFAGEGWHRGVLGIVASRLVDRYHRPVLVFGIEDGMAFGSGRSVDGFDLYRALSRMDGLFERFGGHAHAAGITLKAERLDRLRDELEMLAASPDEGLDPRDLVPSIEVDAEITLDHLTSGVIRDINALGPFGEKNPEPVLFSRSLKVLASRVVGGRHLKLTVRQDEKTFEAIGFGQGGRHPLSGKTLHMIFTPELSSWQGSERIQLRIADLREAGVFGQ